VRRPALTRAHRSRLATGLAVFAAALPAAAVDLTISPAAFRNDNPFSDPGDERRSRFDSAGGYRVSTGGFTASGGIACDHAALHLPPKATITSLVVWVRDANPTDEVWMTLWRKDTTNTLDAVVVAAIVSSGSHPGVRPFADPVNEPVDLANRTYYLEACYGSSAALELHGVTVQYSGPLAGESTRSPVVLPAAAFHDQDGTSSKFFAERGYFDSRGCTVASVALPPGARIASLGADLYDNSSDDFDVRLMRKRFDDSANGEAIATVELTGAVAAVRRITTTAIPAPLVSDLYEYYVHACPHDLNDQRVYAVRIGHDDPIFADGFESADTDAWLPPASAAHGMAAADFQHDLSGGGSVSSNGAWRWFDDDGDHCAVAAVTLPAGATVVGYVAYLRDTDALHDATLELRRKPATGAAAVVSSVTTSGANGFQIRAALFDPTADGRQLFFDFCVPPGSAWDLRFSGVWLYYNLP
jgi:hypothetical protein